MITVLSYAAALLFLAAVLFAVSFCLLSNETKFRLWRNLVWRWFPKPRYLVLLGGPGAGKGTLADGLKKKGAVTFSTGDAFRRHIKNKTALGQKISKIVEKGDLVSNEIVMSVVRSELVRPRHWLGLLRHPCHWFKRLIVIIDGTPRSRLQAVDLDTLFAEWGVEVELAIEVAVIDPEILVERLSNRLTCRKCGRTFNMLTDHLKEAGKCDVCGGELYQRKDDAPDTIRQRLRVHDTESKPVVDHYERTGRLRRVYSDRVKTKQDVLAEVEVLLGIAA